MSRTIGDRRSRPRFEIVGDLRGTVDLHARLTLRDVSPGGALLESPVRLTPETEIVLAAMIDGEPYAVPVRVRHTRPLDAAAGTHLVGVEFLAVPAALAAFIASELGLGQAMEAQA